MKTRNTHLQVSGISKTSMNKISTLPITNLSINNMKRARGMKAISSMARETDMASSSIRMEATTKASGKTTKWMVSEDFIMRAASWRTKDIGQRTSSMVLARCTTTIQ